MITASFLLSSAFILGFAGSMHCVGMCGPIALALPSVSSTRFGFIISRVMYNIGRIVTYAALGLAIGAMGGMIRIAGLQEWLSIISGIMVIAIAVFPRLISHFLPNFSSFSPVNTVKKGLSGLFRQRSYSSLFFLGLLNGLLPCGFVYVAFAGALNTETIAESAVFMGLFGLGTMPAMLAVSLLPHFARPSFRGLIKKITPVLAVAIGTVFIMRGMGLDIPYISPKLQVEKPAESDCCRHHRH